MEVADSYPATPARGSIERERHAENSGFADGSLRRLWQTPEGLGPHHGRADVEVAVTTTNEARSRAGKRGGASLVDTYGVDHMRRIGRAGAKRGGRPTYGEAVAWAWAEG